MTALDKITLNVVADRAGVSKQTVSRVVNNHEDVAPGTRSRVQRVIDELGYTPNALARGLSSKRSRTFGVISSLLEYYGPRSMFTALDRSAHRVGYRMIPALLHGNSEQEIRDGLRGLLALQPDCIIWEVPVKPELGVSVSDLAGPSRVPMITMNDPIDGIQSVLEVDDVGASKIAVEHLLDQGYRHVGIITGPPGWCSSERRIEGWRAALTERRAPSDGPQVVAGDWTASSGQRAVRTLTEQFPEMDAVFACNDQMALGALHELNSLGRVVPSEVGVVGYDDVAEAAYFTPGLTTVRQPYDLYGQELVTAMLRVIERNVSNEEFDVPEPVWIRPELVVRQSSLRTEK